MFHWRFATLTLLGFMMVGCATSSTHGDLRTVQELAGGGELPEVGPGEVDSQPSEHAQELLGEPLTASRAVRIALINNREVRAVLRELGVARGQLMQAGLLPNPTVTVVLSPEEEITWELALEVDVTELILAPMRADAASSNVDAARFRASAAVVDLAYRVRAAYFAFVAAWQSLGVSQRMLDAWATERDAALALDEAGNAREIDTAVRVAAFERARITVAEQELQVGSAREVLNRLLGLHGSDLEWTAMDTLPPVPEEVELPDELEASAIRASLEMREAQSRLESIGGRAGAENAAGLIPDLSVEGIAILVDHAADGGEGEEWRFGVGIQATLPVFNRRQGTVHALEAEFDALLERYYGMAIDIRSASRSAAMHLVNAHARARHFSETVIPAQARVSEQTMLQYNAMQVGIFRILDARREELMVQLAAVATQREFWTARAALEALLAGKQVSGMAAGNSMPMQAGSSDGGH